MSSTSFSPLFSLLAACMTIWHTGKIAFKQTLSMYGVLFHPSEVLKVVPSPFVLRESYTVALIVIGIDISITVKFPK